MTLYVGQFTVQISVAYLQMMIYQNIFLYIYEHRSRKTGLMTLCNNYINAL